MNTVSEKAQVFKSLHEREGAFVIPNPWDAGSAMLLAGLGFEALATTSNAFAHSLGRGDGEVTRDEKLEHCRYLSRVTEVPISADLENCYAHEPQEVARTISLVAETGVVGGSVEDFGGEDSPTIYDFNLAVERVQAAVEAAGSVEFPFMITARAEGLLRGEGDIDEVIKRLQAFEAAGADVLYAPALRTLDEVRTVADAVEKPLNVLAPFLPDASVETMAQAGAKRISVGGALGWMAVTPLLRAGREMLESGTFAWTSEMTSSKEAARIMNRKP